MKVINILKEKAGFSRISDVKFTVVKANTEVVK